MEASVYVPKGTDMSVIEKEYPDLSEDEGWSDEEQAYFLGYYEPNEEDDEEWLAYDECIEFVGFCEGAIEQAECLITDWGPWAMSMLRRKNFSDLAFSDEKKASYKQNSDIYWAAYERGKAAAKEYKNELATN